MATFHQWLAQRTTTLSHYFRPALVRTGNIVNFADATTKHQRDGALDGGAGWATTGCRAGWGAIR